MNFNRILLGFFCSILYTSAFAQNANISYEVRVSSIQGTEGSSTSGASCWEFGDDEYTANLRIDGPAVGANFCMTCNAGAGCTFGGGTVLATVNNVTTTSFSVNYDLFEDDGGARCTWNSGDDCRATGSYGVSLISVSPALVNSYNGYTDVRVYNSGSSTWNIRLNSSWRYAGTATSITPTCSAQNITYTSGNVRSNAVYLTAGRTYRFEFTSGADTYLRLYGSDGYTIVASNDDFNGLLSRIAYTPTASGWYYIEGSDYTRANLSVNSNLQYEDITPAPGNPAVFGNNSWISYVYSGGGLDLNGEYSGFYTMSTLNFNATNFYSSNGTPSEAPGWQGCFVSVDNHVVVSKRIGFPCGNYSIDIPNHDDDVRLYVNGVQVYQFIGCCAARNAVWTGFLDANSTVELRHVEYGGGSTQALNFNLLTTPFISGAHNSSTLNGCLGSNPANLTFTTATSGGVSPYSYQWQLNSVDIPGATANAYDHPAFSSTGNYAIRCKVTDACGTILYTTPKPYNIVDDPNAPTATKVPNQSTICNGAQITLSNPVYGSLAGQSCGFEYAYSTDNGTTWSANSTTIPSFAATGVNNRIRIRVIGGCADGCNASSWTVYSWDITQSPTLTLLSGNNNQTICEGNALSNWSYSFTGNGTISVNGTPAGTTTSNNANTYLLSGSPTQSGTFNYTITIQDACNQSATQTGSILVQSRSTAPVLTGGAASNCPNTNINIIASGGTTGTGSQVAWYTGPNGTGTLLGYGNNFTLTPQSSTVIYARREGTCNSSTDAVHNVVVKNYAYAASASSTTTGFCTDNNGWKHFYNGNDILFSAEGDFSNCPSGYPVVTISNNNSFYQQNAGPFQATACANGLTPGEQRFEMSRSWNLDMGGGAPIGSYNVRFYYQASEKQAIETAAANWIATYPACNYQPKYATANGFYWFKNTGSAYVAPQYDGTQYTGPSGSTSNGVNYAQLNGITSFSGGTGAIILVPDQTLPIDWQSFTGTTDNKFNYLNWVTASEQNTQSFEVQRSKDGVSFERIGTVTAAGTSNTSKSYNFTDRTPLVGQNYYRIRMIENTGNDAYSNVVVLEVSGQPSGYTVYPNPTADQITLELEADKTELVEIEVIDLLGRTLLRKSFSISNGKNQLEMDLSKLTAGTYFYKVTYKLSGIYIQTKITKV